MSRHGLMAKINEAAMKHDQMRHAAKSAAPESVVSDKAAVIAAHEEGERKKAADASGVPEKLKEPPRNPNSLFYKLYPQDIKEDATQKARHYWAKYGEHGTDSENEQAPLASDEAMSGAFTALRFVNGQEAGSSSSAPAAGAQKTAKKGPKAVDLTADSGPSTSGGSAEAEALKKKLLEALGGDAFSAPAAAAPVKGTLCEGADVDIFGLVGAKELNGKRGRLQFLDGPSGRWQVEVDGVGAKRLKPDNLRPRAQQGGNQSVGAADDMTYL